MPVVTEEWSVLLGSRGATVLVPSVLAHRGHSSVCTARQLPEQKNICALFGDL